MYDLPAWGTELLRGPHVQFGQLRARLNGATIQLEDTGGDAYRDRTALPLTGGEVTSDGSTPGARRVLSATLAPQPGLWDLLIPPGVELLPSIVLRAPNGNQLTIPQGVFPVEVLRLSYGPDGRVTISSCPDRWSKVAAAEFITPRVAPAGTLVRVAIASLLAEVLPTGTPITVTTRSTATVPAGTWDTDRDKTIEELATAASLDVFFDRNGFPVIRDAPTLAGQTAWLVDASASGVLLTADRERSRQKTYNVVVVSSSKATADVPFDPQIVWDNDPASSTYAGPDPVNNPSAAGPFGVRVYRWSSPLLADAAQALAAARTILERVRGQASQLSLTAAPHPGLDDGDVITVQLPRERSDMPRPVEPHLAEVVTVPLLPSRGGVQRIATRSTRPDVT